MSTPLRDSNGPITAGVACTICMCAFYMFIWATPFGLGVSPDSTIYIDLARNIIATNAYAVQGQAITHFPPMYPVLLAFSGFFGVDPLPSARWIHAGLYALNLFLAGMLSFMAARRSAVAGIFSLLILFLSAPVFILHAMAWSEPLFIFFSLAAILFLAAHLADSRTLYLFFSSLLMGMAILTRYIGLSLLPAMILTLWVVKRAPLKTKMKDALMLASVGGLPIVLWLVRNLLFAGTATNRPWVYHPIRLSDLFQFLHTASQFWFPLAKREELSIILFLLIVVLSLKWFLETLISEVRNAQSVSSATAIQAIVTVFYFSYVVLLFASKSFADAHTPMRYRIEAPLHFLCVVFVISIFWNKAEHGQKATYRFAFVACMLLLLSLHVDPTVSSLKYLRRNGLFYSSRTWRNSETMRQVEALPRDITIYSNAPDAIQFLSGKSSKYIPRTRNPISREQNPGYTADIIGMRNDILRHKAVIVYFNAVSWRRYLLSLNRLEGISDKIVKRQYKDGVIFEGKKTE